MYIARSKRQDNIAEYILYLWQLEDLLRALEFSPDRIYVRLVEPHPNYEQHEELLRWYLDICDLMRQECITERGHLEHTKHLIADLNDLHNFLLQSPVGKEYGIIFARLSPEIDKLGSGSDIERCFKALYSVVLCRLKGTDNEKYITDILDLVSPVIAHLARIFHQTERGEINPYQRDEE